MQVDVFQAIVLGFIQGMTEFLPISSRAHLILVPWLFGWSDPGLTFDVALHLGTLAALLIYFYKDWLGLLKSASRLWKGDTEDPETRLAFHIIVATIPAGVAGVFLGGLGSTEERYVSASVDPTCSHSQARHPRDSAAGYSHGPRSDGSGGGGERNRADLRA